MQNFNIENEVWLVYDKKSTGEQRIQYNDAVEEALCFGWIDSINKTLDKDHTIQRFTPRQSKSSYSQPNKERLKWLAEKNLIHHSFLKTVQEIISKEYVFPLDILDETWDLLHNLESIVDEAYQNAIRQNKVELEKLMHMIDTAGTDFMVEVKG